jgi:hypothetical protein
MLIETGAYDYAPKNLVKAIMLHRSMMRESSRLWHICQPVYQAASSRQQGKEIIASFSGNPRKRPIGKRRNCVALQGMALIRAEWRCPSSPMRRKTKDARLPAIRNVGPWVAASGPA